LGGTGSYIVPCRIFSTTWWKIHMPALWLSSLGSAWLPH
jgi:hypothetical protein